MKTLLIAIFILLAPSIKSSSDPCADLVIMKTAADITTYHTPWTLHDLYISKMMIKSKPPRVTLKITIVDPKPHTGRKAVGVFIKLQNGKVISDPRAKINCEFVPNLILPGGDFRYSGYLVADNEMISNLLKSPVTRLGLWDMEKEITKGDGAKILTYISCLNDKRNY